MLQFVKRFARVIDILSKAMKSVLLLAVVLGVMLGLIFLQHLARKGTVVPLRDAEGQDYRLPETTYTPPVVKLPFTKSKQPVASERLPIPKEAVAKTVKITIPSQSRDLVLDLVIDKEGRVYKTLDFPEDAAVSITKWQPPLLALDFRFGYSLVVNLKGCAYHCLSLDYLRVWRFRLGSDVGLNLREGYVGETLVGLSVKYGVLKLGSYEKDSIVSLSLCGGWDFLGKQVYIGGNISW